MKKLFAFVFAASILLCLAACGSATEDTGPHVSLTDVAAEAVPADEIVPADVNEVAVASEEMLLSQPMDAPMDAPMEQPAEPAFGDPSSEPAEDGVFAEDTAAEE